MDNNHDMRYIEIEDEISQEMDNSFGQSYSRDAVIKSLILDLHSDYLHLSNELASLREKIQLETDEIASLREDNKRLNELLVFLSNQVNGNASLCSTPTRSNSTNSDLLEELMEVKRLNEAVEKMHVTSRKQRGSKLQTPPVEVEPDEQILIDIYNKVFLSVGTSIRNQKKERLQKDIDRMYQIYNEEKQIANTLYESIRNVQQREEEKAVSDAIQESIKSAKQYNKTKGNNGLNTNQYGIWPGFTNGFPVKMMDKWNWSNGRGLGKSENGITTPIDVPPNKPVKDANVVKWPENTVLIAGSSMIQGLDGKKMSRRFNVKVRSHSGATTRDMYDHLNALLRKEPQYLILHVGTNDASDKDTTADTIFERLMRLKLYAEYRVPGMIVTISCPTFRKDNSGANRKLCEVTYKLKRSGISIIDHDNITGEHLGGKGLHLNRKGVGTIAKNLIAFVKGL